MYYLYYKWLHLRLKEPGELKSLCRSKRRITFMGMSFLLPQLRIFLN
jgi:hypothetical protein